MQSLADLLRGIRPEVDFAASHDFMADGVLDSFDMVALVATLDEAFGISIDGVEVVPGNFRNLESIAALLRTYGVAT